VISSKDLINNNSNRISPLMDLQVGAGFDLRGAILDLIKHLSED